MPHTAVSSARDENASASLAGLRFYIDSLGCAKNLVDSEATLGMLQASGLQRVLAPDRADLLLVNTCGFLEAAREESVQRIIAHVEERVDFVPRQLRMTRDAESSVDDWLGTCLLTGKRRSDCRTYTICAFCDGPNLSLLPFPYMISDLAMDDLQKLLSKKTRDRLDDFIDEYLGLPPEFKDLPLVMI